MKRNSSKSTKMPSWTISNRRPVPIVALSPAPKFAASHPRCWVSSQLCVANEKMGKILLPEERTGLSEPTTGPQEFCVFLIIDFKNTRQSSTPRQSVTMPVCTNPIRPLLYLIDTEILIYDKRLRKMFMSLEGQGRFNMWIGDCRDWQFILQSHKSFRTKQKLARAQKQNRPIPQWIRLRTGNTIRYVSTRLSSLLRLDLDSFRLWQLQHVNDDSELS